MSRLRGIPATQVSFGVRTMRDSGGPMKISWVFDLISPYSYLSLKQLSLLPAGTQLEPVPVLFAGLLNHHGQVGNAEIASKRRFTYRFVVWRARKMGVP